jgi:hypothetical protein
MVGIPMMSILYTNETPVEMVIFIYIPVLSISAG